MGDSKIKKDKKEKGLKFEEAVEKLEAIVQKLEGTDVPLEEALELFEEGVRLSKACHQKLTEAEKKVKVLLKDEEGNLFEEPFESEEDGDLRTGAHGRGDQTDY